MVTVLFRSVASILAPTREERGLMPRLCTQFLERVVGLIREGCDERDPTSELGIVIGTIHFGRSKAQSDAGNIVGVNCALASKLAGAKRRIRDVE